jgi:hypothetical protein
MTGSLSDVFVDQSFITAFGQALKDAPSVKPQLSGSEAQENGLIEVHGIKVAGSCVRLPAPLLVFLPGPGFDLDDEGECDFKKPFRKWILDPKFRTSTIEVRGGDLQNLLGAEATPRAEVSGSVTISNWHWQNGDICFTAHVAAHVKQCACLFGHCKCVTLFDFSRDINVCLSLSQCFNLSPVPGLELTICYNPPTQVCAELSLNIDGIVSGSIGKWCYNIPIPKEGATARDCGCQN